MNKKIPLTPKTIHAIIKLISQTVALVKSRYPLVRTFYSGSEKKKESLLIGGVALI